MAHHENAQPNLTEWDRWCQNEYTRLAVDDVDGDEGDYDDGGHDGGADGGGHDGMGQEGGGHVDGMVDGEQHSGSDSNQGSEGRGSGGEDGGAIMIGDGVDVGGSMGSAVGSGGVNVENSGSENEAPIGGEHPAIEQGLEEASGGESGERAGTPSDGGGPEEGAFPFRVDDSGGNDGATG